MAVGASRCRAKAPKSCGNRESGDRINRGLRQSRGDVAGGARAARQYRHMDRQSASRRRRLSTKTEEVQQIVRICAANGVAVIPFGVGTSLEGHVNAPAGGVSIDFRDMNKISRCMPRTSTASSSPGSPARRSMNSCATAGCSSRSIPAPTLRSAAWRRPAAPALMRCATEP